MAGNWSQFGSYLDTTVDGAHQRQPSTNGFKNLKKTRSRQRGKPWRLAMMRLSKCSQQQRNITLIARQSASLQRSPPILDCVSLALNVIKLDANALKTVPKLLKEMLLEDRRKRFGQKQLKSSRLRRTFALSELLYFETSSAPISRSYSAPSHLWCPFRVTKSPKVYRL